MIKSEVLRNVVSTAAVGCLLPDANHVNGDMNDYEYTSDSEKKDGQWELKKGFMNMRKIYHEPWIKHQKITFDEQKNNTNPMYMRMNGDTKKPIRNELTEAPSFISVRVIVLVVACGCKGNCM